MTEHVYALVCVQRKDELCCCQRSYAALLARAPPTTGGSKACAGTQNTADLHSCSNSDRLASMRVDRSL